MTQHFAPPGATGLYDPANEHDGCGIALVANVENTSLADWRRAGRFGLPVVHRNQADGCGIGSLAIFSKCILG